MTRRDPQSLMWAQAFGLLEEADRLHRQFCKAVPGAQPNWEPPADVVETAGDVVVVVALPGVAPEHISVHFDESGVAIHAERPASVDRRTTTIRRLEIPYGRFERRVALPPGHYELVEQSCLHGCLRLRLQKR